MRRGTGLHKGIRKSKEKQEAKISRIWPTQVFLGNGIIERYVVNALKWLYPVVRCCDQGVL